MENQERRKRKRNQVDLDNSASIEIHHALGSAAKSVYNVLEYDEHGLSFMMPQIDGRFHPGVPLEYSIMNSGQSKVENFGLVKYFRLINNQSGETYFKVGLENTPDRAPEPAKIDTQLKRDDWAEVHGPKTLHFSIGGKDHTLPLANISHYTVSFFCSEDAAWDFPVSRVLESAVITCAGEKIFKGTFVVMRRKFEEDRYRIVIGARTAITLQYRLQNAAHHEVPTIKA